MAKDDGSALPQTVADAVRISLIKDLLEGVVWCHLQVRLMRVRCNRCVKVCACLAIAQRFSDNSMGMVL